MLGKLVAYRHSRVAQLLGKRQDGCLERRERGLEVEHHAGVVLLRVNDLLVVRFAEYGEHRAVDAVGRLDDERDKALVRVRVEIVDALSAVLLMAGEVKVCAVVRAVDLAPAEREEKLDVARRAGIVGELLVVVIAQMLGVDAEVDVELASVLLEVGVQLLVGALFAEGLELRLLELYRAEDEVAGGYLVAERLAYLTYREGELGALGALHVQEVDILALRVLRTEIDDALRVGGDSAMGLEHEVELTDVGEVVLAAVRAGYRVRLDVLEHLLLGHRVGVRVRVERLDEVVRADAHLALLAVKQRVAERRDVTARLPHARVHEDAGVQLEAVVALLNKALAPRVLDRVLETRAERAVVPCVRQSAVYLAAGIDEAAVLAERDDLFHCLIRRIHFLHVLSKLSVTMYIIAVKTASVKPICNNISPKLRRARAALKNFQNL